MIIACCDLLSFYYLCRTGNNDNYVSYTFVLLWFAFILLSLSYWKQLVTTKYTTQTSCDLLSFYYLCRTGNNPPASTTDLGRLWFAFILLSLSYWKQHCPSTIKSISCCDLLSFYYLCRTGNNRGVAHLGALCVVICFHFTIFVVLETTPTSALLCMTALWFAFILLSLSYWKQQKPNHSFYDHGCDLLSFYYLCRTGNNLLDGTPCESKLWFAFILLSLSYWKQLEGTV